MLSDVTTSWGFHTAGYFNISSWLGTDMNYSVEQIKEARESFGPYRYRISLDGEEVAVFWHNYRGECEGIRTSDGHEEDPPFGMCSEFLTGGGPLPSGLTRKAMTYLDSVLDRESGAQPMGPGSADPGVGKE